MGWRAEEVSTSLNISANLLLRPLVHSIRIFNAPPGPSLNSTSPGERPFGCLISTSQTSLLLAFLEIDTVYLLHSFERRNRGDGRSNGQRSLLKNANRAY